MFEADTVRVNVPK